MVLVYRNITLQNITVAENTEYLLPLEFQPGQNYLRSRNVSILYINRGIPIWYIRFPCNGLHLVYLIKECFRWFVRRRRDKESGSNIAFVYNIRSNLVLFGLAFVIYMFAVICLAIEYTPLSPLADVAKAACMSDYTRGWEAASILIHPTRVLQ